MILRPYLFRLNGIDITLFIPFIIAFTIAFNPLNIPSLIPSNIFPPVLNTFFTACQACVNFSLNQFPMFPKTDVIAFQAPDTPCFTLFTIVFHTLEIVFTIPFHIFVIVFFTELNTFDIISFMPLNIELAVSFIPFQILEKNSLIPFHTSFTLFIILSHKLIKNCFTLSHISFILSVIFCHNSANHSEIAPPIFYNQNY